MKRFELARLAEFLLDNLFDITTILVSAVLVTRFTITPPQQADIPELATWILAVLGLISVSGLWDRNRRLKRIEKLSQESRDLASRYLSGRVFAKDFFLAESTLSSDSFSSAMKVCFVGKMLARTTREFMHVLGKRLAAGASIRFIILDPESDQLLHQCVLRGYDAPAQFFRNTLETVETVIQAIAKTPGAKGKIEIGYLPYIPSFGLIMIDPDEPHGYCRVEIYHHKSAEKAMMFELSSANDPYWFEFLRRQFDMLWESCRTEDLTALPKQSGADSE